MPTLCRMPCYLQQYAPGSVPSIYTAMRAQKKSETEIAEFLAEARRERSAFENFPANHYDGPEFIFPILPNSTNRVPMGSVTRYIRSEPFLRDVIPYFEDLELHALLPSSSIATTDGFSDEFKPEVNDLRPSRSSWAAWLLKKAHVRVVEAERFQSTEKSSPYFRSHYHLYQPRHHYFTAFSPLLNFDHCICCSHHTPWKTRECLAETARLTRDHYSTNTRG